MDWLFKAALTAALVAALLLGVQWCGQRIAGWVIGLPTVTVPALGWLTFVRGPGYAAEAAAGAVAVGAPCALFALVYGLASRRHGPLAALTLAAAGAAALLPVFMHWRLPTLPLALLSAVAAVGAAALLQPRGPRASATPAARRTRAQIALTAAVAGAVSGIVTGWAGELGAYASGLLAGAPLVAAAGAVHLHRVGGGPAVVPFVRGYLGGLVARTGCVALLAFLLAGVAAASPA